MELAGQDLPGQRILEVADQRPLEGARPVLRVVPLVGQEGAGLGRQLEVEIAFAQQLAEPSQLEVDDAVDLVPTKRVKDDDVVEPVEELRPEGAAQLVHYFVARTEVGPVRQVLAA